MSKFGSAVHFIGWTKRGSRGAGVCLVHLNLAVLELEAVEAPLSDPIAL